MEEWGAEAPPGGCAPSAREVWVMAGIAKPTQPATAKISGPSRAQQAAVGAVCAAALEGGRTWHDYALCPTKSWPAHCTSYGCGADERRGRWGAIVRRVPIGAFAALLAPPGAAAWRTHRDTLSGFHRGLASRGERGNGYFEARSSPVRVRRTVASRRSRRIRTVRTLRPRCNRYLDCHPHASNVADQSEREALIALHRAGARCRPAATGPANRAADRRQNAAESRAQQLAAAVFGAPERPPPS